MRSFALLLGICFVGSLGCERPNATRPAAVSVSPASPHAVVVPVAPPTSAVAERPADPDPLAPFASERLEPLQLKPNPLMPPGPDYVWVRPYTKLDGTPVNGYWRKSLPKPEPKPFAKSKSPPPKPVSRVEMSPPNESSLVTNPQSGKFWVKPYTRKDGTNVDGHWRKK